MEGWGHKNPWSGFDYIPIAAEPAREGGRLYLGAWENDEEERELISELKRRNIGLVIGLGFHVHPLETQRCTVDPNSVLRAKIITAGIEDFSDSEDDMRRFIKEHIGTMHAALLSGQNVYVHCHAGISRSPTFVLAYLMEFHACTYEEASEYLRKYRPQICPNPGFVRLLRGWQR